MLECQVIILRKIKPKWEEKPFSPHTHEVIRHVQTTWTDKEFIKAERYKANKFEELYINKTVENYMYIMTKNQSYKKKKNWWHAGQDIYTEKCKVIKFSVRKIAEEISQEVHVYRLEDWVIPQSNSS